MQLNNLDHNPSAFILKDEKFALISEKFEGSFDFSFDAKITSAMSRLCRIELISVD